MLGSSGPGVAPGFASPVREIAWTGTVFAVFRRRCFVEGEGFAEEEREAPAVEEEVVEAPEEAVLVLSGAQEGHAQEGGSV